MISPKSAYASLLFVCTSVYTINPPSCASSPSHTRIYLCPLTTFYAPWLQSTLIDYLLCSHDYFLRSSTRYFVMTTTHHVSCMRLSRQPNSHTSIVSIWPS
ncbi:hypothetical protein GY45DRAFT_356021 [Cubamyces sp. BRFM 1775]|nr:hypothetical protein GY45DRAFT_356021 [Cubamyces sp. BRFM 1775]